MCIEFFQFFIFAIKKIPLPAILAQAILAQATLVQGGHCFSRGPSNCVEFFASLCHVSRCPVDGISCQMVGGSGQSVVFVRFPKNWPRVQQSRQRGSAPRQERSPLESLPLRQPSRAPGGCREQSDWRDQEFGGCIGPASVHAKILLTAFKATQERSKVGPIQEHLDSCRQFIE